MTRKDVDAWLFALVVMAIFVILPGDLKADGLDELCDVSSDAVQCDDPLTLGHGQTLVLGDIYMVIDDSLNPKYASIDKRSMSLVFELGAGGLLFINRHNGPHEKIDLLLARSEGLGALGDASCDGRHAEALACLLLGKGNHTLVHGESFSEIAYFESDSSLHGQVNRAFIFDEGGTGYFDVLISPNINCNLVRFSSLQDEALLDMRFDVDYQKVAGLLEAFVKSGSVDPELVEEAGFAILDGVAPK